MTGWRPGPLRSIFGSAVNGPSPSRIASRHAPVMPQPPDPHRAALMATGMADVMADVRRRLAPACASLAPEAFEALVRQISERKLAWQARDAQDRLAGGRQASGRE